MLLQHSARVQILLCLALISFQACGDSGHSSHQTSSGQFSKVFVVVEENRSFSEVMGNPAMPYFNNLASTYGLATQYYANTHPSVGNYFMLTTGQIVTNNEAASIPIVSDDNVVRELLAAGHTWKSYAEALPAVGYIGGDVYPYVQHHNPFVFFSDVVNSSEQLKNLVPFSQFAADLSSNNLPDFSFIVPSNLDNSHDGSMAQADSWLKQNIEPLVSSSLFQKSGLLIVLFDESDFSDLAKGGGHIATVVVSPLAKKGYKSTTLYQHENTLRLVLRALGVSNYPGAAASAADMDEFFQ